MKKHSKCQTINNQDIEDIAGVPVCYSVSVSGKVQEKISLPVNKCIYRIMTGNVLGHNLQIFSIILVVDEISAQEIKNGDNDFSFSHKLNSNL